MKFEELHSTHSGGLTSYPEHSNRASPPTRLLRPDPRTKPVVTVRHTPAFQRIILLFLLCDSRELVHTRQPRPKRRRSRRSCFFVLRLLQSFHLYRCSHLLFTPPTLRRPALTPIPLTSNCGI